MEPTETFLSITHAAQQLGIAAGTLRDAADRGEIPCVKSTNGDRMFRPADITAYRKFREKKGRVRAR